MDHPHLLAHAHKLRQVVSHCRFAAAELYGAILVSSQRRFEHPAYLLFVRVEALRVRVGKAYFALHIAAVSYLQYRCTGAAVVRVAQAAVIGTAVFLGATSVFGGSMYPLLHPVDVHIRVAPEQHLEVSVLRAVLDHIGFAVYTLIAGGYFLQADRAEALSLVQYLVHIF